MFLLPPKTAFHVLAIITFAKFITFFYIKYDIDLFESIFSSGNDSGYYHAYAIGDIATITSAWPVFLRFLYNYGVYDRYTISVVLLLISIIIPFILASLLLENNSLKNKHHRKIYWNLLLLLSFYPSIFLLSLDIYRDMIMIFLFSIVLFLIKKYIDGNQIKKLMLIIPIALLTYILFLFRDYLGVSILIGFLLYKFKILRNRPYFFLVFYFLILITLNSLGYLNSVLEYRGEDGFTTGNTTLGVSLLNQNIQNFLILYFYSAIMQLSGFFITSISSIFVFITESVFFILAIIYTIKNRTLLTPFTQFLIIFSLCYASIWIIGNDNIGTATRLRTFNYITTYLIAAIIYLEKIKIHSTSKS